MKNLLKDIKEFLYINKKVIYLEFLAFTLFWWQYMQVFYMSRSIAECIRFSQYCVSIYIKNKYLYSFVALGLYAPTFITFIFGFLYFYKNKFYYLYSLILSYSFYIIICYAFEHIFIFSHANWWVTSMILFPFFMISLKIICVFILYIRRKIWRN